MTYHCVYLNKQSFILFFFSLIMLLYNCVVGSPIKSHHPRAIKAPPTNSNTIYKQHKHHSTSYLYNIYIRTNHHQKRMPTKKSPPGTLGACRRPISADKGMAQNYSE
jgi:hypothetical protein